MRRLRWGCLAVTVLAVVVAGVLWSAWRRQIGPRSLAEELAAARREGVPIDLQDLRNAENQKPPNAAAPYLAAVAHATSVVSGTRWEAEYAKLTGSQDKPRPVETLTADERAQLRRLLAAHAPAIASLRQAGLRPALALHRSWPQGDALPFPDLPMLRLLVKVLATRAELRALEGDPQAAWDDLTTAARAAALLRDGLSYIEAIARTAAEVAILQSAERLLLRDPTAKENPKRLRRLVDVLGPPPNPRRFLIAEPYMSRLQVATFAKEPVDVDSRLAMLRLASVREANEANHVAYWRTLFVRLPHDPLDIDATWSAAQRTSDEFGRDQGLGAIVPIPFFTGGSVDTLTKSIARRRLALAAADVLEAWTATRRFPTKLPNPILDPFDRHPLRYRPAPDGFTLYSLDADRVDNGGRPSDGGHQKGDLVWRFKSRQPTPQDRGRLRPPSPPPNGVKDASRPPHPEGEGRGEG